MARKKDVAKMTLAQIEKDLPKEKRDFIALVRAGRKDPVLFAYELLGVELHDGQKLWLWMTTKTQTEKAYELGLAMHDDQRKLWANREEFDSLLAKNPDFLKNILVPSNRWGKTLCTSVKHLWYNFYKIGVRGTPEHVAEARCGTLNLSPHSNQCQAGYDYILDILFSKFTYTIMEKNVNYDPSDPNSPTMIAVSKKNECKIPDFYLSDNSQKRMVMFKNGTSYKAVPTGEDQASSLAGTRYLYISYDEAAQSLHLKAELPAKIMSRLIDFGGPMDLVSTPEVDKPSHQYFFHISKLGLKFEDGWFTLIGRLMDNIFLGAKEVEQIAGSIKSTDPVKYRQVVYGEFVTTGKKMFDQILIERLWDEFAPSLPQLEHKYLVWADWGFADTGDPTVFYVLDYTPRRVGDKEIKNEYRVVYREAIRGGSPYTVLARFRMLQREWNGARCGHDSSGMGGVILRKMLMELGMTDIIDFSASGDKSDMLFCLIVVMSEGRKAEVGPEGKIVERNPNFGRLRSYYIAELEEQMGNYQYNPDKGVSDKRLEQDEVMCLGMAVWWLERKYMKSEVKNISFNPLAPTAGLIFNEKEAAKLSMHTVTIPEKRIF
jgi:hypothetical protein